MGPGCPKGQCQKMSDRKVTPKQTQAIKALLECPTIELAAEVAGVNPRTLYRWLDLPHFRAELTQAESTALDLAGRGLVRLVEGAVNALDDLLTKPDQDGASVKRLTANTILEQAIKLRELRSVEQRLADLEAAVYGKPG